MKPLGLLTLVAALLFVEGCATTTLRGRLRLPAEPGSTAPSASRGKAPRESVTDAVVYVDRIDPKRPARPRATEPPTVVEHAHRFEPRIITVPAGTTVRFVNRDRIFHKLFSISPAKSFTSRPSAPRTAREVTFDKPGVVRVFCEVDRHMDGFVFVVPSAAYTQPDATGTFEIKGLPRGRYRVAAWHPDRGEVSQDVDLKTREVGVRLRF